MSDTDNAADMNWLMAFRKFRNLIRIVFCMSYTFHWFPLVAARVYDSKLQYHCVATLHK